MAGKSLTDVAVRSVKAAPGNRLIIYDGKVGGLCLRVSDTSKSWSFVYRPKGGVKQRRLTIGTYPAWSLAAAREKAEALRRAVQDGGDPVRDKRTAQSALTVDGLIDRFVARYAK